MSSSIKITLLQVEKPGELLTEHEALEALGGLARYLNANFAVSPVNPDEDGRTAYWDVRIEKVLDDFELRMAKRAVRRLGFSVK